MIRSECVCMLAYLSGTNPLGYIYAEVPSDFLLVEVCGGEVPLDLISTPWWWVEGESHLTAFHSF